MTELPIIRRLPGRPEHVPPSEMQMMGITSVPEPAEWSARTYADELLSRGDDPHVRVQCPCGRTRPAYAVIDVSALPPEIRGSAEWACEACVIEMRWAPGSPIADVPALAQALGAPAEALTVLTGQPGEKQTI